MEREVDFFSSYKAVSSKLKKRFLKKPNLAEAREEFHEIAKSLNSDGSSHYAGFCCLAMARCELNMSNPAGEVQSLIDAARHFLHADELLQTLGCPNYSEHLTSAKNCFEFAIKNYVSNDLPAMAASLCGEIGAYLETTKQYNESLTYYQRSVELYFQHPLLSMKAQERVMYLNILTGDYMGALSVGIEVLNQIAEKGTYRNDGITLFGSYAALHCSCEVTVVLLLMYLDPHPLKIKPEHSRLLQKYTWTDGDCDVTVCNTMDEDLFVLLQSLVMACAGKDLSSIRCLQEDLRKFLSPPQCMLLEKIIEEFSHPDGLGF